ncbi:phosphopantetheine-binding protein [Flavihumibacter sp.]|uniref:phosphopantetheine-binding protein n=1 Tax=Flavihumibacter sp. TaxID=1913981 RepID=UPI002FCA2AFD|nr:phosphopantetheine-binding protein [Flavihumibacter sediminis]
MEDIKYQLKKQIIEELNLQEIRPEDIQDDAPLFGDGLGLDSIDALELVVLIEKYHGLRITDETVGRKVLQSINAMAEFIQEEKAKSS